MGFDAYLSQIPINNPFAFGFWFFTTIGWIIPVFLFCWAMILLFQVWIRTEYKKSRIYIVLAIDVPKGNEQSPKAVENMFSHLSGAHQPLKRYHKWWKGEVPESFGFEIVSIGGYIQFLVHTDQRYRDLIEAIVYAQYPDAEITEVEDYTKKYEKMKFPNETHQLFGSEVTLTNKEVYPIITHKEFEDSVSGELKDPLASLLEALGRIGPGEEIWVQFLVTPADNDWSKKAHSEINKIIGAKDTGGSKGIDGFVSSIFEFIQLGINPAEPANASKKDSAPNQMLYLTAGQKDDVSAIEHKASKPGFHTRIRYIYIAEKNKYKTEKAVQGVYGSMKQFNSLGLNGLKNDIRYFTGAIVFFKQRRLITRRNKILYRYRWRGHWFMPGEFGKVLIAEELASLWHFPSILVKAPLVQKTQAKRAEPPISLPTESEPLAERISKVSANAGPPTNLPTG